MSDKKFLPKTFWRLIAIDRKQGVGYSMKNGLMGILLLLLQSLLFSPLCLAIPHSKPEIDSALSTPFEYRSISFGTPSRDGPPDAMGTKVTGKPSADDIRQCKKTLPVLYSLRREEELGEHLLSDLYAQTAIAEEDIGVVLETLDRLEALDYVCEMNAFYCDKALEELEATGGDSEARAILEELVDRLRGRPS